MNILKDNPFRILGLFGNSSEREIQKQIGLIKRYAEIGKFKSFEYDFDFIGSMSRELEDVRQAAGKIEQAKKKLLYSLFWFIKKTPVDEIALDQLKNDNVEKAVELWSKTLTEISPKNVSSYTNLSTLHLAMSVVDEQLELSHLQKAIELKGKVLHPESVHDLPSSVTGNGKNIESITLSKGFADEIIEFLGPYVNKKGGIKPGEIISLFSSYPAEIQKYVSDRFTATPFANIENCIEKAAQKRKEAPEKADSAGEELFQKTQPDLASLKRMLGAKSIQFQMIANKLANEILQCAIEFFNIHRNKNDMDPGDQAIKVAKYAASVDASGQVKQRISENSAIIQKWVDDKPSRKKQEVVSMEIIFIEKKFQWFDRALSSIENAKELLISCKPKVLEIKRRLGSQDSFYLQISSLVVNMSLNMVIEVVNREQSLLKYDPSKLASLPSTISSALSLLKKMEAFDMNEKVQTRLRTNKQVISTINQQLQNIRRQQSGTSSGCYIATMAYGSYNHPQVIILRQFRDTKLETCLLGRFFIRLYYFISPHLVDLFKGKNRLNQAIRFILDKIIKLIDP